MPILYQWMGDGKSVSTLAIAWVAKGVSQSERPWVKNMLQLMMQFTDKWHLPFWQYMMTCSGAFSIQNDINT